MSSISALELSLVRRYPKAIVHLRTQFRNSGKLSLVLGAGVSVDFGMPTWRELVDRIAAHPLIRAKAIVNVARTKNLSTTIVTQMLYEHLRDSIFKKSPAATPANTLTLKADEQFRSIVHESLYKDNAGASLKHPYLKAYLPVIRASELTITYNFDNCLERLLLKTRPPNEKASRGYEIVVNANTQFRRARSVIYHPNGILPRTKIEVANEGLIFSEESFADQIFDSVSGYYSTFHNHLSKSTCLFVGLSLDDGGLKHILRQHARNNPGNVHYLIHFVDDGRKLSDKYMKAVVKANFEVYNLYTLFLKRSEIAALGRIITRDDDTDLIRRCSLAGYTCRYIYYVTGVPGSGKSTATNGLKCFHTIDEWLDERLPEMSKKFDSLTPAQRRRVDTWIREQFWKKNSALADMKEGISIVDRTPLDPMSFSTDVEQPGKAKRYVAAFRDENLQPGHVVFFTGDFQEFASRITALGKEGDADYLEKMDARIRDTLGAGVCEVRVRNLAKSHMIKELLRIVMFEDYRPLALQEILVKISKK